MSAVERWHGIGAVARESGLSVSALRFYDSAGLLVPGRVDPQTGYRSYDPDQVAEARLVAALRRAGMPLAGIRAVLAHRADRAAVAALLSAHLRRLEQGVADARRHLAGVPALLDPQEKTVPTTAALPAAELARALRAVRFAVAAAPEPDHAVLGGVLLEVGGGVLTAVATDRYRLAVATAAVTQDGPDTAAVVPLALADALAALEGDVELRIDGPAVTVPGTAVAGTALPDAFPDYRRLVDPAPEARSVAVDGAGVRAAVAAGTTRRLERPQDGAPITVAALDTDAAGGLVVGEDGVGVDVEFLFQALDAGGPGRLVLDLDGPLAPLRIRPADRGDAFSLLMPVRL